jgi:hypothetical protein
MKGLEQIEALKKLVKSWTTHQQGFQHHPRVHRKRIDK